MIWLRLVARFAWWWLARREEDQMVTEHKYEMEDEQGNKDNR